jgi:hypothetical protein
MLNHEMARWEIEDQPRNQYTLQAPRDIPTKFLLRSNTPAASPIMESLKNISPKRVKKRRSENKAARKSRRRNRDE